MLLLRIAEVLSMEDSVHRRCLLWTDPNKKPNLFRRAMYVIFVLYPKACSRKRQDHRIRRRVRRVNLPKFRFFQEFLKFEWLPLPRRGRQCLDKEQDPSCLMVPLVSGRPVSAASQNSLNSLLNLYYLLPLSPRPRLRLERILSIYPILRAITPHLHSTDFHALQQTSNTVKTAIHRSVGPDTSTVAKLTCTHTGRYAHLFTRAQCVLCDDNLCHLTVPIRYEYIIHLAGPLRLIAKKLLDECCAINHHFTQHVHCVRICTFCLFHRKIFGWNPLDIAQQPCQCRSLGNIWVCRDRRACAKRRGRYYKWDSVCADCKGRFWTWFRWCTWQWWIHKGDPVRGVCQRDCFDCGK